MPSTIRPEPRRRATAFASALAVAAALAAALAPPLARASPFWTDAPFETLGDDHRVREGHVAAPGDIAADAERAARGELVGATPAHEALRRTRPGPAGDDAPSATAPFGYPHDGYGDVAETWVADLGVLLRRDEDGDGFFTAVELSIDVDTTEFEHEVYAVVDLREPDGTLTLSHVTRSFTVRGNAISDTYRVEIELLENHRAAYRDIFIDIRDAWDDRALDILSPDTFATLAALPLEAERPFVPVDDGYHDDGYHPPVKEHGYAIGVLLTGSSSHTGHTHGSSHHEDGYVAGYAGAAGPSGALALAGLALLRRRLGRSRATARRVRTPVPADARRRGSDFL